MVLYVPNLGVNLFSIAAITELGVTVHFIVARVSFNKNESVVMVGERIGKTLSFSSSPYSVACFTISPTPSIDTCHLGTYQGEENPQDGVTRIGKWSNPNHK